MPDRHHHDTVNRADSLAAVLRRLPAQAPPGDMWPMLAARARRRRRLRHAWRIALPTALAAGIALAIVLPLRHAADTAPPPQAANTADHANSRSATRQLALLRRHSQRLQVLVQQLDAGGAPLGGSALARAADLQDQIGLVDLQLNVARTPHAQLSLWRQRVVLLQRLAMLHLMADGTRTVGARLPAARAAHWID